MTHSSSYRQRSGAHRPRRRVAAVVVPLVLVPVVVAALLVGVRLLPLGGTSSSVGTAGGAPSATSGGAPSATSAAPSSDPADDGAGTVSAAPSSTATESLSASPSSSAGADVDRSSRVTVLNGTSRAGLATRVADALRSGGWAVGELGNYRDSVLTTTVYYPGPGLRATARALSSDLPGDQQVVRSTRFGTGVTVVLGLDYPG
jgi:hypothetical protein